MKRLFGLLLSTLLILGAAIKLSDTAGTVGKTGWIAVELSDTTVNLAPGAHCYSKRQNVGVMEKGESKSLKGECVQANCTESTAIHYEGCSKLGARLRCKIIVDEDLSKPYPDCCPKFDTACIDNKKFVY